MNERPLIASAELTEDKGSKGERNGSIGTKSTVSAQRHGCFKTLRSEGPQAHREAI